MLSFKDYLKALLPGGSLWQPIEEYIAPLPEPNLLDGDMEDPAGPELLIDGDMEQGPGPEELTDGNMEAPNTTAWSVFNGAVLTKSTVAPYSGSQALRVAYGGTSGPRASQSFGVLTRSYKFKGWARGDGINAPKVYMSGLRWTGSPSLSWQYFEFDRVCGSTTVYYASAATAAGYAEFDDCSIVETVPAYDPGNSALLTKEPYSTLSGTSQALRVAYSGVNHPNAYQTPLVSGRTYRITGKARGDGVTAAFPRVDASGIIGVWTGSNANTWQAFDVSFVPTGTVIQFYARTSASGYCEYDDISVVETCPSWLSGNSGVISKSTSIPQAGSQSLQVSYGGTNDPYAYQVVTNIGQQYRVAGYAKSDGVKIPELYDGATLLWTGTNARTWQPFDLIYKANSTQLRLQSDATTAGFVLYDTITLVAVQSKTSAHFDLMLEAIGDMLQEMYEFLKALAHIRDPRKTIWLDDLEKEYGFIKDDDLTEQERRDQIAALKYAKRGTGSLTDLQNILNNAGFTNLIVRGNSPPVDPRLDTLGISEPIVNGSLDDFLAEYIGGLQNPDRWQNLFFIYATTSPPVTDGWPYQYGGEIHRLKNSGDLLLYSDYFTHLVTRDYSKYRDDKLEEQNIIRVKGDGIKFDHWGSLNLLNDGDMEQGPGPELLVDHDMEKTGVTNWGVGGSGTLTKQGSAYEGSQCLRVAYNGVNSPYAYQDIMTAGRSYRIQGFARSDGTYAPRVRTSLTTLWNGVSTHTNWQPFDITFVTGSARLWLQALCTAAGYCEFDLVSVRETAPAWTPGGNALLTKETTTPREGLQTLRVYLGASGFPRAEQTIFNVSSVYLVTGYARGDGTAIPRITDNGGSTLWIGTSSSDWQHFSIMHFAAGTDLRFWAYTTGAGYCEFDDVKVVEANQQVSYIKEPYHPRFTNDEEFSIICLADFQTQFDGEVIYSKRSATVTGLELRLSSGPDAIELVDQTSTQSIAHSISGDAGLGVSGSDSNAAECFIDGVSIGNFSGTVDLNSLIEDHYIGNDRFGNKAFQSIMRGFLYFDRVLTADEHLDIYTELAALKTPEITAATLTDTQKSIIRNLVVKFKPVKSWGLLAIKDTDDFKFTFCNTSTYPGDAHKGFASTADMRGGRLIDSEEF